MKNPPRRSDSLSRGAPRAAVDWLAHRSTDHLPALALYLVATLVMTWPYPLQVRTSLYNWSDALLNSWTLAWGTHALLTDPLNLYNANIFYPYSNALAYSESLLPQTALGMPIILSTYLPSFAHNLLALLSFVLAGFGMYLLVFDLTRSRAGALVAGMIFTFTSFKMMHVAHLQLLTSQWMPFALLYLRKLLSPLFSPAGTSRGGIRWRAVFLFSLFFSLQALSSFYYAFFIAVAAGLYIVTMLAWRLLDRKSPGRQVIRTSLPPVLASLLVSIILIAIMTIPFALPYFSVQRDLGLERGLPDAEYYAATLRTYFSVPDGNWLYRRWLAPRARITGSGERDFAGVTALALGLLGLVAASRRDREKYFYVLLAITGLVLSFGARNEILLFTAKQRIALPFYLPYRYLFEYVPGFRAMRGPDRFAYLAILGLAVFAGYGTQWLTGKLRGWRPHFSQAAPVSALALVALIGLENISIPLQATNPATLARPVPDYARFLAQGDSNGIVVEIPMVYQKESLAWPQYYSIYHWDRLVNGFSGFFPPAYDSLVGLSAQWPNELSLAVFDEMGVTQVVVHNDLLTPAEREGFISRVAEFPGRISLVKHAGTDDVYALAGRGGGWGDELARSVPLQARVTLLNGRAGRRLVFELAAVFLRGRELSGDAEAALHPLAAPDPAHAADYVIVNADDPPGAGFSRPVWKNNYLAVYGR